MCFTHEIQQYSNSSRAQMIQMESAILIHPAISCPGAVPTVQRQLNTTEPEKEPKNRAEVFIGSSSIQPMKVTIGRQL